MKTCSKCLISKEENEFYFQANKINRIGTCKVCHNARMMKWAKENPEKTRKAWTKHNRKRCKGRICPYCGKTYKVATSQNGCSTYCRFFLSFEKNINGCWEWKGYKSGRKEMAYASLWVNRICRRASHISYEIHKGPLIPGLFVLHTCDNPKCVNPDHLYLGTHQQNMDDMNNRGRGNKDRFHLRKYTLQQIKKVFILRKEGKIYSEIAAETGVNLSSCKYICKHPERLEKL